MERNGNGMEMEIILSSVWNLCGNRMDCSVEFQGERNGKGMEINLYLRWNSNGMEWNWNGMEWNVSGMAMEWQWDGSGGRGFQIVGCSKCGVF